CEAKQLSGQFSLGAVPYWGNEARRGFERRAQTTCCDETISLPQPRPARACMIEAIPLSARPQRRSFASVRVQAFGGRNRLSLRTDSSRSRDDGVIARSAPAREDR